MAVHSLIYGSGQIEIRFEDGTVYPAALEEKFTEEACGRLCRSFVDGNIGECLRAVEYGDPRGIFDYRGIPTFMGVDNQYGKTYMYIFELTPDSIYCRAARFVATDRVWFSIRISGRALRRI